MTTKTSLWAYTILRNKFNNLKYNNQISALTIIKHMNLLSDELGLATHWRLTGGTSETKAYWLIQEYTP